MTTQGVAVVTGAARGIGRQIALKLAADGFDIAVCDVEAQKAALDGVVAEIRELGRQSVGQIADVTSEDNVKALIAATVSQLGGVDVMVANAGICLVKPMIETTPEEFDRVLSVNVRGLMLCYKYAALQMIAQGRGGRIIGASSIAGKKGYPSLPAYSASKFAVRGLTQSAAQELGKHGITVNAYAPGAIETDMLPMLGEDLIKALRDSQSIQQVGSTLHVANLVSHLASKGAHFITGQSITVDGGLLFD